MDIGRAKEFHEVLKAASREVDAWPAWKQSDEAKAWQKRIDEQTRQFEQEKANASPPGREKAE